MLHALLQGIPSNAGLIQNAPVHPMSVPERASSRRHMPMQATIMTDPGLAHRTFIGPMTVEYAEQIIAKVRVCMLHMLVSLQVKPVLVRVCP